MIRNNVFNARAPKRKIERNEINDRIQETATAHATATALNIILMIRNNVYYTMASSGK